MCQASCNNHQLGQVIELSQAVGMVLAHDMTEVLPGEFKGAAFKKGHIVRPEDLEHLARMGKQHLYVLNIPDGMMHEDQAALVMAKALIGEGVEFKPTPSEGKINLTAAYDGLFKVNVSALTEFNMIEDVMCASRHSNTLVKKGQIVAGTRAIPLVIAEETVRQAADLARELGPVFSVKPISPLKAGMIVTGNEVYSGLIKDKFAPMIRPKLEAFGCPIVRIAFAPDDPDFIANQIEALIQDGARLIVLTGGMSVDPDDVTRLGVMMAGATDVLYGSSVLPGAMLLSAYIGSVAIIGVPACGMFHDRTILDLVLPRVLAGERLSRRDMAALGHGGLCLNCTVCRYPICPFGKGN